MCVTFGAAYDVPTAMLLREVRCRVSPDCSQRSWLGSLIVVELLISLLLACVAGVLIFLKIPGLDQATRYAYSVFDLAVALVVLGALISAVRQAGRTTFCSSTTTGQS